MNNEISKLLIAMLEQVARRLVEDTELFNNMVFVGGCTTVLLLDAARSEEYVRHTQDVDLIVNIATRSKWYELSEKLEKMGFIHNQEDGINCRFNLQNIIVDFMPIDESILGYSNKWYKESFTQPDLYTLPNKLQIKVLKPVYFIATKIEAFKGRGNNDLLGSRDIEDILTILNGRVNIVEEIYNSADELKEYLSNEFDLLSNKDDWNMAIQGNFHSQPIIEKINLIIKAIINKWPRAY